MRLEDLSPVQLAAYLRQQAYTAAASDLKSKLESGYFDVNGGKFGGTPFSFSMIDQNVLDTWRMYWSGHSQRLNDWDWVEYQRHYRNSPSRFELAVWSSSQLCGMALGKPSSGRENLSVVILEGSPNRLHPLKGIMRHFLIETAQFYAVTLQCRYLYLLDPLPEAERNDNRHTIHG